MTEAIYDVAVIGAGCVGAVIARRLSAYDVRVVLLEKCCDVGFGVSKANSGIIHAGFHHPVTSLKAQLEIRGNLMFDQLHHELNFPFKRVGIIVAAFSYEQMKAVEQLYEQGVRNGVPLIEVCGRDRLLMLEPKLNPDVAGGLYAPTGGIIEPYRYVFALVENALKNGVALRTEFRVVQASRRKGVYEVRSAQGDRVRARHVVNAAGLYADEVSRALGAEEFTIVPRKGEEFLLERNAGGFPNHVVFPAPGRHTKGMLVIPTVEGTIMIGPTADEVEDKEDFETTADNLEKVFASAMYMIQGISRREIITSFAGLRPVLEGNDFYIDISAKAPHVTQAAGIQSPGLTAAPAIALWVLRILKDTGLPLKKKSVFHNKRPKTIHLFGIPLSETEKLVKKDPALGDIVCRCEMVSFKEIQGAIERGATTLDGIKFRTRAQAGRCHGGFCTTRILKILADAQGVPLTRVTKKGAGSEIVKEERGHD